jgi:hypothetical protein
MRQLSDFPPWADAELSLGLTNLCARGEGQSLEFKATLPAQGHDVAKSIAAFASSGAGQVLYGVADDGQVVGLPDALEARGRDAIQQRVMNAARDVKPAVHTAVRWALHNGSAVCVVDVEKGVDAVYYANHRPIVRRGSISRPAEPGEVENAFRSRYANDQSVARLPATRQIAQRMAQVLERMNIQRIEPWSVADLAGAMELASPAELEAVFESQQPVTFAMLDHFCERFAIDKEWLATGRGAAFRSSVERRVFPEDYLALIEQARPDCVYLVRSQSKMGEAIVVVESDVLKCWCLPDVWHVSSHVGGGGSRDLLHLFKLFRHWAHVNKPYMVLGRMAEAEVVKALYNGDNWPGTVAALPLSHWWDDLTDLEHLWTTRTGSVSNYGKGFVAAQDIIRRMLARETS